MQQVNSTQKITSDILERAIEKEVRAAVAEIVEQEIAQAEQRTSKRIRGVADSIALKLLSEYKIRDMGRYVEIKVIKR